MNQNQQYFPNHEKWIKYYNSIGTSEHPYFNLRKNTNHTSGSVGKSGGSKIIPIEKLSHKHAGKTAELKVEFVSPAQQVVEQAVSEIKREKGIKRKSPLRQKQSSKSNRQKKSKIKSENVGNQF